MVKIIIENLAQKELILNDLNKTVLHQFHVNRIDWLHACGGKGRCTTCKMIVQSGMENLNEMTAVELNYRQQGLLKANERLACQAVAGGTVSILVPEESKLAHMKYTD